MLSPPLTEAKKKNMDMAGTFPMRVTLQAMLKPVYYITFLLLAWIAIHYGGLPVFPVLCMFTGVNWLAKRYNYIYDN